MSTPAVMGIRYDLDPAHTSVTFKVRHLMISNVKGEFARVTGSVTFNPADLANSSIDVSIDAASINTRDPQRDEHLKGADFLDVAKYPNITFQSDEVIFSGTGTYEVTGNLAIHGVTREIALAVDSMTPESKDPWGSIRRGASANVTIDRREFGLVWNSALETGGVLVGDDVHISIELELVRKAD